MTPAELQKYLSTGEPDFEFDYAGKSGSICLCDLPKVHVLYDGIETVSTFDKLMSAPFLNGKSFSDVAGEIVLYG